MLISFTLLVGCLSGAAALVQEMDPEVELLGPVATDTSRTGDRVFERVLSPNAMPRLHQAHRLERHQGRAQNRRVELVKQ